MYCVLCHVNKSENCVLRDVVPTGYQGVFTFKMQCTLNVRLWAKCGRPMPGCTEHTDAQQHYVQVSCTDFYSERTVSMESADRNSLDAPKWSAGVTAPVFTKLAVTQIFVWTHPVLNVIQMGRKVENKANLIYANSSMVFIIPVFMKLFSAP